ncbi:Triosephosphate isomerase [Pavlovales sp. CCMP2436]|nr:Triosephosphate isomerase [Pavlovales sp. CCMP2436]
MASRFGLCRGTRTEPEGPPRSSSNTCPLFVGCNWKCAVSELNAADALVSAINKSWAPHAQALSEIELVMCPPHVLLGRVRDRAGAAFRVGAQNVGEAVGPLDAGTGVTTAGLLRAVGAEWVVLGHSDRRNVFGETDALLASKAHACLAAGLAVNLTVGETRAQREAGVAIETVLQQVAAMAERVDAGEWARVVIAYEPVWAVGDGATPCTPEETQRVHSEIRSWLKSHAGTEAASKCRLVYTGSVNATNCGAYAVLPDVDGFVVGRAGLEASALLEICQILVRCKNGGLTA